VYLQSTSLQAKLTPNPPPTIPSLQELLALPAEVAAERAASYIELWGFRNTYAFGKHLTEKALGAINRELHLPLAIVRPSLVSAIAAEPFPGYCGGCCGLRVQLRSASVPAYFLELGFEVGKQIRPNHTHQPFAKTMQATLRGRLAARLPT